MLKPLRCSVTGTGKSKKQAKSESAFKAILDISHIPDVQKIILSFLMASNIEDKMLSKKTQERPSNELYTYEHLRNQKINTTAAEKFIRGHLGL